ncbi:Methionyl-tRNA synthetase [Methanonatronarchaeum thermophilum]|uniref:Methionine--tRNA ligase n=1 Tax=Methanonatronarchaeum thermophilum TaxID=1927129 RepID=A0A1Y3GCB8_9EURY|nr:methionine--tRNA ligase [Methanonatronarchaeum thermophilum]OUJ19088.1 Methionyl-tRNA synthetase [Methanonatronarchaeum thermophilum]
MRKILVTTAWPYGNGPIHLGHFAGMVLPADIFARYHRMKGNKVAMVSGTDMHGTPISLKAEEEGMTPKELSEKYHKIIKKSLRDMGASYELYTKTTTENHYETTQDIFKTLKEKNHIYKDTMDLFYCPNCDRFLPDRYVEGVCPHCEAEDARGDQCDECGMTLDPIDLKQPYCSICNTTPIEKQSEHHFLKLSEFNEPLSKWIKEKEDEWKPNVINFTKQWLEDGLEDRPITRDMEWGVPIPNGEKGKSIYVWFDAVIGYLSATKEYTEKWREYWQDDEAETYYFIGKDNIPFHAIIWPAMLMGYSGLNLPYCVSANEFLNLEGRQFSTSRNWAVWLNDVPFDPDAIRYYLTSIMPENKDSNFTWEGFQTKNNEELVSTYGNYVHRVLTLTENKLNGEIKTNKNEVDPEVQQKINETVEEAGKKIDNREFKKALEKIISLAAYGNTYLNQKEPWKNNNPSKTLYNCLNIVKTLAITTAPFMPNSSNQLWKTLNNNTSIHQQKWSEAKKPIKDTKIHKPKPLFKKIENEEIEQQINKLGSEKMEDKQEKIPFEKFQEMDIRIVKIKKATQIEGSDKLLKIKADIGNEERQFVAGLAKTHKPQELEGKQVVAITNLEEAKIFGEKSQGMILAADENDKPILLQPENETKTGTPIK